MSLFRRGNKKKAATGTPLTTSSLTQPQPQHQAPDVYLPSFQAPSDPSPASGAATPFAQGVGGVVGVGPTDFDEIPEDEMAAGYLDLSLDDATQNNAELFRIGLRDEYPTVATEHDTDPSETSDDVVSLFAAMEDEADDLFDAGLTTTATLPHPGTVAPLNLPTPVLAGSIDTATAAAVAAEGDDDSAVIFPGLAATAAARAAHPVPPSRRSGPPGPVGGPSFSDGGDETGHLAPADPDNDPATPAPEADRGPGRSQRRSVVAAVAALATVLGVGTYAYAAFAATGDQPERMIPATSVGYVKVDLDPPAGQKAALVALAAKAPGIAVDTAADRVDAMFADALRQADAPVTYDQVKPWLGSRIAVAFTPDPATGTAPVLVAAVTDQDEADATLTAIRTSGTDVSWTFRDQYAIVAPTEQALARYVADLDTANITTDPAWNEAVSQAGTDTLGYAYANLAHLSDILTERNRVTTPTTRTADGMSAARLPKNFNLTGTVAVTVRATPDAIEINGHTTGSTTGQTLPGKTPTSGDIAQLPATTTAAVAVSNPAAVTGADPAVAAALARIGLPVSVVDTILGGDLLLAANDTGGTVGITTVDDVVDARTAAENLIRTLGITDTVKIDTRPAAGSGRLYVANDPAWAAETERGGTLGDTAAFQAAVDNPTAGVVGYLDTDVLPTGNSVNSVVSAVGLTADTGTDSTTFTIRLVIGP